VPGYCLPVNKSRWSRVVLICAVLGIAAAAGVVAVRRAGSDGSPTSMATTSTPSPPPAVQESTPTPTPSAPTPSVQPMAAENRLVLQNPLYKVGRIPASRCKEPTFRATSVAKVTAIHDPLWTRTTMAVLIGHEYGHHVQAMTGILGASHTREDYINGVDEHLAESRRRELQASCLSGVYLGADKQYFSASSTWFEKWKYTVRNRGDEWNPQRDHGNKANHSRWSLAGFASGDPATCNTFAAKPATVS